MYNNQYVIECHPSLWPKLFKELTITFSLHEKVVSITHQDIFHYIETTESINYADD